MWKVMPKSSDGRSALADSTRSSLFDTILKANAEARRKFFMASLFTVRISPKQSKVIVQVNKLSHL
jgi:hypothetical protein